MNGKVYIFNKNENYSQICSPKMYFLCYELVSFANNKETFPAKQFAFFSESILRKFELKLFIFCGFFGV